MDDFAAKENKGIVKEKNLYTLHLDTPRIIIISCVIIGLVVISTLIGMNISKGKPDTENLSQEDAMLSSIVNENKDKLDTPGSEIDSGISLNSPGDTNSFLPGDKMLPNENMTANKAVNPVADKMQNEPAVASSDILSHENIDSIIPPAKEVKTSVVNHKHREKAVKKNRIKKDTNKKKDIVEVASAKEAKDREAFAAPKTQKNYYAVQVAAFDKKSKAVNEVKNLEEMDYDAFIDSSEVKGKQFYKVKIGPVYSKKKACELLDEVSQNKRYEESYLVEKN